MSVLRAHAALALVFALLASLAPLGTVARAQAPKTKEEIPVAEDGPVYVIYQTPDGDVSCRLATPGEIGPVGDGTQPQPPLRQLNHLPGKESITQSASAGLTIILRGTARLELPENAQAKAAFIAAAAKWEEVISSQIVVTIDVDYGPDFFGTAYSSSSTLGATSSGGFIPSYTTVRQRINARATPGSEEATLLNNLPATSLPTDIGDVSTIFVPTAMARALGLNIDENTAPVPRIGFNSNFSFDFNHADGINSTQTDFDAVAVHEIGHALGFTSQVGARELNPSAPLRATVWDMFRFRPGAGTAGTFSSAPRVLSSGTTVDDPHVYFSGAGELALSTGKPDGTGGDDEQASHWKDDRFGPFIGIMDPTLPRGRHEEITANDLRAIDFFGYSVGAIPEPPNNHFANAQQLTGSTGRVTGTNRGATKEPNEPTHSDDTSDSGGRSVWYRWTAPSTGSVTFHTGNFGTGPGGDPPSNFDTTLAAYTGASVGALTPIKKNDDINTSLGVTTSAITFNAVGGTTYMIAVDGYDGDVGQIALSWNHVAGPITVQFSSAAYATGEGSGGIQITVTRTGGTSESFNVNYAATDGTANSKPDFVGLGSDYGGGTGTLQFGAGTTSNTFTIFTHNDPNDETNETVNLTLSNPTNGVVLGTPSAAVLTIIDDDPGPFVNVSDVFVSEGNAGTANAVFEVSVSSTSSFPVSVNYATANGTATAGSDYVAASGTVNFAPGESRKTVTVLVNGDTAAEDFQETFFLDLSAPTNAVLGDARGQGVIHSEEGTPGGGASVIEFGATSFTASETSRSATLTLTRTNSHWATVDVGVGVRTVDNAAAVRCDDTTTLPGVAFARCDYLSTITPVTFAPGESLKTITIPLVDDAHGEPNETVRVEIASTGGALFQIGANSAVDLVITSDEAAGQTGATNPLDGNSFFVRMQYLDFLNREPEAGEPWTGVLDRCLNVFNQDPNSASAGCDRLLVSESFFRSPEFNLKGGFIFRFYKLSFNRLPEYSEIAADMRSLTGATPAEVFARRSFFTHSWTDRTEFTAAFSPLLTPAQFVNALMDRYQLQQITTPDPAAPDGDAKVTLTRQQLIDRMMSATLTRAQVVRAIADSDQVSAAEFKPSFVAMQYYGYLRRTPEPSGFQAWLNYLNANPNDSRTMINGFVNSQEYRLRFGRP